MRIKNEVAALNCETGGCMLSALAIYRPERIGARGRANPDAMGQPKKSAARTKTVIPEMIAALGGPTYSESAHVPEWRAGTDNSVR